MGNQSQRKQEKITKCVVQWYGSSLVVERGNLVDIHLVVLLGDSHLLNLR